VHVGETLVGNVIDSVQRDQLNAKECFLITIDTSRFSLPVDFDALMLVWAAGTLVQPQHQSCPAIRSRGSAWRLVAEVDLP
jgi:hypothetical protein